MTLISLIKISNILKVAILGAGRIAQGRATFVIMVLDNALEYFSWLMNTNLVYHIFTTLSVEIALVKACTALNFQTVSILVLMKMLLRNAFANWEE